MMSDVLTEMCVLGGCATHRTITDDCKHCGNYRAEIERRRTLPLTDGADGLKRKNISTDGRTLPANEYIDKRGWRYKVQSGIGQNTYKAKFLRPDRNSTNGWHGYSHLPWRDTFDEAQTDLDDLAAAKGWEMV